MTELVNALIFSFILLFGVEAPIYSERSQVTIDTETKTIQIEYFNLQTEEEHLEKIRELLSSFQTPVDLHPAYEGLKLESYRANLNNRTVLLSFDSD